MIKVVPYKKELLSGWYYNGLECPMFDSPEQVLVCIDDFAVKGRAYIGYDEHGEIIGVAGMFLEKSWGVGYSWSFINEGIRCAVGMIKTMLEIEPELAMELGIKRLQTFVDANSPAVAHFMEALKYEREGIMKKAGPNGEDLVLFAKIVG